MIITSLHFTSLHFTSLHFNPHFSIPCTFGRFVTALQNVVAIQAINTYKGSTTLAPLSLKLGTRWRWDTSGPGRSTPETKPSTLWQESGWGPRAGLGVLGKSKNTCSYRYTNPGPSNRSLSHYTHSATPAT